MANRYWVGGTASWDATAGTKWALTSGGAGGQAVPTSSDDVFFDGSSGSGTITLGANNQNCNNLNFTGFTGTFDDGGFNLNIFNTPTFVSGMTFTTTGTITLQATTGTIVITSGGKSFNNLTCTTGGASWQLADNLTCIGVLTLDQGTFDLNNKNVTSYSFSSSNSNVRSLTLGNGTWTLTGTGTIWNMATSTNATITKGTATIKVTDTTNTVLTFSGGGLTYPTLWFSRGGSTSTNTIAGSNSFDALKDTGTVAHTTRFTAGTTTTLNTASAWQISGNSGQLITITSTTTGIHTLSCASGTISADYLAIAHSVAGGGATYYAGANSTNNQATATAGSGWIFTAPPVTSKGNMFLVM